ncbi:MAG: hypothetical protein VX438_13990 [Planctomycetota bacterium]|nr:hypothetical protein [Planctomycetota bacterium]
MIGIFPKPKLLITTLEKVAIERELLNLGEFFGTRKWRDVALQVPEQYAQELASTKGSISTLFETVCGFLELDQEQLRLVFSVDEVEAESGIDLLFSEGSTPAGDSGTMPEDQVEMVLGKNLVFESLLGAMVRKLVAAKLVLSGYVDRSNPGLWQSAEVATVFFGFGLFASHEKPACCDDPSQEISLISRVPLSGFHSFGFGYLLALVLWTRQQTQLSIARYLRPDAGYSYRKSLRFLQKTRDSLLVSTHVSRLESTSSISTLESWLKSGTPSERVWGLELILQREDVPRSVTLIQPTLFQLLKYRDRHVVQLALRLIGFAESLESSEILRLKRLARGSDIWISSVVANILSRHLDFCGCETEFARLVDRFDFVAANNAAQMAGRFGSQASKHIPKICYWLRICVNRCDDQIGCCYAMMLLGISNDPQAVLEQVFGGDEELFRGAFQLLEAARETVDNQKENNQGSVV